MGITACSSKYSNPERTVLHNDLTSSWGWGQYPEVSVSQRSAESKIIERRAVLAVAFLVSFRVWTSRCTFLVQSVWCTGLPLKMLIRMTSSEAGCPLNLCVLRVKINTPQTPPARCTARLLGCTWIILCWMIYTICLCMWNSAPLYLCHQGLRTLTTKLCRLLWYLQSQSIPHPRVITRLRMGQMRGALGTELSLLIWLFGSCPLGGFLHLSLLSVFCGGYCKISSLCRPLPAAWPCLVSIWGCQRYRLEEQYQWKTSFFLAGVCDQQLLWLTWGLKWDIVFSILHSVSGKGSRK